MNKWEGPYKCGKCGCITSEDWGGEIEYADGSRYHFSKRGGRKGVLPIWCGGEMKPYERRRTPDVAKLVRLLREARKRIFLTDETLACEYATPAAKPENDPLLARIDAALKEAGG